MTSRTFVDVMFGPYLPDFGGLPNPDIPGYLVDAVGVRSTPNGLRGLPVFANVASATAIGSSSITRVQGIWCPNNNANGNLFVITNNSEIYESRAMGTDTWQNVTPSGTAPGYDGDFLRFSTDAIHVSIARAPVKKTLTDAHATLFTALAGSPPTAACAARVRNHVVLGSLSTDPYAIRTSAIGDHEDWPTPGTADARAKQAITESLPENYGIVRRIVGDEKTGIIFQERALTRMTYVGGSAVYEFDTYARKAGVSSAILISRPWTDGTLWYWYDDSNVWATDGYSIKSISSGKINEAQIIDTTGHPTGGATTTTTQVVSGLSSAFDEKRGLVIFSNETAPDGNPKFHLAYNVRTGDFSLMNEPLATGLIEAYNQAFGSSVFTVNNSDRKLRRISGSTPAIVVQTGFIEIDPGYRVQLQGAHLLGNGTGSLTLESKTAATSSACDASQSGFTSMTAASLGQKKTIRDSAQYAAFRITGTGAESQLMRGIRIYYERAEPSQ